MATMSRYCKAYLASEFRKYKNWSEKPGAVGFNTTEDNGQQVESSEKIRDDSCLFLHDSLIVSGNVFNDENIIFDDVTADWEQFCKSELQFEVPEATLPEKIEPGSEAAGV